MPVGPYTGTYDGKVFDNVDPNKDGRIRVTCAEIFGDVTVSDWIPSSEGHSGQLLVPEIGDIVSLTCKDGDCNQMSYGTTKHMDGQTPSSAKNDLTFDNTGISNFPTCGDYTVTEPAAPARSDYPGIKTIMENQNAFVELDDNGRFQYYNKTTKHFMEWHPDGTLVIKAKRIYVETSDSEHGFAVKSNARIDFSAVKDFTISAYEDFNLWVKQEFLQTVKETISIVATKLFKVGSGKGIDIDSDDRVNIGSAKNITIVGKKVDIVNEDDI